MPTIDNGPDGKEEEENEVDENEKDSVEQSSSSDEDEGSCKTNVGCWYCSSRMAR